MPKFYFLCQSQIFNMSHFFERGIVTFTVTFNTGSEETRPLIWQCPLFFKSYKLQIILLATRENGFAAEQWKQQVAISRCVHHAS